MNIHKVYPSTKKAQDKLASPYIYWVLRPLSFKTSYYLYNAGVSAMACTIISAAILLLGNSFFLAYPSIGLSSFSGLVVAAFLINLYLFLDVVDGNIARMAGSSSNAGEFADSTVNIFAGFIVPIAAAISLYLHGGDWFIRKEIIPEYLALIAGLATGYLRLLRRVIFDNTNRLAGGDRFSIMGNSDSVSKLHYTASVINSAPFPLLLIAAIFQYISVWLILYFVFNSAITVYVIFAGYRKARAAK